MYGLLQLPSCLLLNTALTDAGVGVWDLHCADPDPDVFMNSESGMSHPGGFSTADNPVNRKIDNLLYLPKVFAVLYLLLKWDLSFSLDFENKHK